MATINFNADGEMPKLISKKTIKTVDKLFVNNDNVPIGSTDWVTTIKKFYNDYIEHNIFGLIVIVAVIVFLIILYIIKKDRELSKINKKKSKKKHKKSVSDKNEHFSQEIQNEVVDNGADINSFDSDEYNAFYNQTKNDEFDDIVDNVSNLSDIHQRYDTLKQTGEMSDAMAEESRQRDISRYSLDELARLITG